MARREVLAWLKTRNQELFFVAGIAPTCDVGKLRKFFDECGQITKFDLPMRDERRNREAKPRGMAFITYASHKGVKRALAQNAQEFEGRTLKVQLSKEKKEPTGNKGAKGKKGSKGDTTLFVRNLPHKATEADVKEFFR